MGNGAKAQQKRERAQKEGKTAKSQLKVNKQACDIQCQVCKSTFLKTTKGPAYVPHDTPELTDLTTYLQSRRACREQAQQDAGRVLPHL
ncbi:hypothetical protein FSOLCH5_001441 [Fusarium solani]